MEQLLQWDSELLLWINGHHSPFWDTVMWYCTQSWIWIPLYVLLVAVVYFVASKADIREKRGLKVFLLVVLGVACMGASAGLADFITSGLLKKWICRPRPTHSELAPMLHILNGYTGGQYGFPSSHAANTMAVATSFWLIVKSLRKLPLRAQINDTTELGAVQTLFAVVKGLVVLYVIINCYSRMYLGVHYPLDIVCGAVIGWLIGWLMSKIIVQSLKFKV